MAVQGGGQPVPLDPPHVSHGGPSLSSMGLVLGIVLGGLALLCVIAVIVILVCYKRRKQLASPVKQLRTKVASKTNDDLLQQLKEQEFDCHDIEICIDEEGNEIELGSGGFGRVVKGVRDGVQPVAIKMMYKTDQKAQEDFLKEIKLLKHVSLDANIVQYFGASFQEDQLWLVTEFMEGGDLRRALSADEYCRLTWWNGGKQIALDAARGLAFLHRRNVIHRDIKSHNILLTREGRAKVADVGMAQIMSEDHYATGMSSQQGTFAWASPELLLKEGRCTEKADIYSFGVCLWEIVTSQMPKRGEMFCPSPEECPPEVARIIQECMCRDPKDRPSAREIYRRLRMCEPLLEDKEQLILDSAEAVGRASRLTTKSPLGVFSKLESVNVIPASPVKNLYPYDSPMSIGTPEEGGLGSPCQPGETSPQGMFPASNNAFSELVARFSPAASNGSSGADGSGDQGHIHPEWSAPLPEFILTTDGSQFMDFTQTQSTGEWCRGEGAQLPSLPVPSSSALLAPMVPDVRLWIHAGLQDAEADQKMQKSRREDCVLDSGDTEKALLKSEGDINGLPALSAEGAALVVSLKQQTVVAVAATASCSALRTGASSIHTGSTACYEDAEEHPAWMKDHIPE